MHVKPKINKYRAGGWGVGGGLGVISWPTNYICMYNVTCARSVRSYCNIVNFEFTCWV